MKERIYDRLNTALDRRGFGERRDRLVADLRGEVLELGAGTGLNIPRYRHASRVVALEPDASYARRLRERAHEARVPVEVVDGSAEELPFAEASFDHVVASLVLCSVRDLDRVLGEIRRVLRPGGTLVFLEHVRGAGRLARWQTRLTPLQRLVADGCHLDRDTPEAIRRSGLEIETIERFALPGGHPLIRPAVQGSATKA